MKMVVIGGTGLIGSKVVEKLRGPSAIARDFPAVTLPALIGTVLALWAVAEGRAVQSTRSTRKQKTDEIPYEHLPVAGWSLPRVHQRLVVVSGQDSV